jgi:hypothetical protein
MIYVYEIFYLSHMLFFLSSTVVTVECEMKIAIGKIKSFPIFMKIGRSERSHIEMIILEYQHPPMTDKRVIYK